MRTCISARVFCFSCVLNPFFLVLDHLPVINTETADAHFVGDILDGDPLGQESSHPVDVDALTTATRRTTVSPVHIRRVGNERLMAKDKVSSCYFCCSCCSHRCYCCFFFVVVIFIKLLLSLSSMSFS